MSARRDAFTLVELLVAMALTAIIVMWLTQTFTVQHRTYTVVEQVTEAQQNSLAVSALLEREVRAAGFLVPENAAVCGVDNTNAPDVLYVSAAEVLSSVGVEEPDLGVELTAGDQFNEGGGAEEAIILADRKLDDGDAAYFDADGNGVNDTDFGDGMGVIAVDLNNLARGAACGRITVEVEDGTPGNPLDLTVDWDAMLDGGASASEDILVVPAHVYRVNAMNLLRDGVVLAPDVEDFQVSYFFDVDGDGVDEADGSEEPGTAGEAQYESEDWQGDDLREVRVAIVVRSRAEDPNANFDEGEFQATENRAAVAGSDGFRRRVHRSVVRPRNVGFRDL